MVKINLLINNPMVRSGYVNIDPLAGPLETDKVRGDIANLDHSVEDAEATEIIALDVIDFLPVNHLEEAMTNWLKKLRHGGVITIGGIDIGLVAKAIVARDIDVAEANTLLYGEQSASWNYRKSTLSLQVLVDTLRKNGLKIITKKIVGYRYIIKAERD